MRIGGLRDRVPRPVVLLLALLVATVAAAIFITAAVRHTDLPRAPGEGHATVTGPTLPPFVLEEAGGAPVPTLASVDQDGDEVVIDTGNGRPKAILVVAHWSEPSAEALRRLSEWMRDTGGLPGVDIYAVSTAFDPTRPPSPAQLTEGIVLPVLQDDEASHLGQALGARDYPYLVFVSWDGTLAVRGTGRAPIQVIEETLGELLIEARAAAAATPSPSVAATRQPLVPGRAPRGGPGARAPRPARRGA